jgi:hypothetical protein
MDLDALRDRDRKARTDKLYGHPSTAKEREREAPPKVSPASAMATRHADEVAEQRGRHHEESSALYQKQHQALGARLQTSHPVDANFEREHARQRDELHEKHARERSAMQRRHLVERDGLRQKRR